MSSVSQGLTRFLVPTGEAAGAEATITSPEQQDGPEPQLSQRALEAAYGCVDWFLYPQKMQEGAG
jgi:hypothetical protein